MSSVSFLVKVPNKDNSLGRELSYLRHFFALYIMQYLEDIIELVEDLPEEICKRFEQIRKWDSDVERLKLECKYAAKRIMEVTETSQSMRERILMELADKYRLIHRLSERKLDLAIRSQRLMSAVLDKVNDSSYLCKIELEVDNPGCTENIERNFCRMLGLRPTSSHLSSCNMEFETADDASSVASEHSNGRYSPAADRRHGGRHRLTNGKPHREKHERSASPRSVTSEGQNSGTGSGSRSKKRKYQSDGHPTLSNYMRKKQEKERERSKLARVHAARQEESQRKQQKLSIANDFDTSSPCKSSDMAPLTVKTEENLHVEGQPWESQDPLGSEDDLNAEEVLDLFPMLPSPPREIMESLKEESLFGLEDDIGFDPTSKAFSDSPAMSGLVLDSLPSSPSPSTSVSSWDRKKRTSISFGNVETTSIHGRPRKMTERAVELLQNHKVREDRKRKVDIDGETNERWCFCREGSSGSMICCDASDCKYQWFHFEVRRETTVSVVEPLWAILGDD
ncbi:unnamed protein product [Cylicocyclus nassatus]|uniref:Inhibitor of growth protein N-terminal histone-binding domain-containing protein n=1 Tax=Cylicocyclus nassatus TaxID=53992 RepID=A0AA36HB96_CYLNA|nr:unnamed protein product [Cylicocyclus nassatus]